MQSEFFTSGNRFERWPPDQRTIHPFLIDLGPYEPIPDEATQIIERLTRTAAERAVWPVVSHERLSGHPSSGGYDSRVIADRLKHLMPAAKVLIVFREQDAMIRSAYSQFVTEGGSLSLRKYLQDPQPGLRKMPRFSLKHFEFAPAIEYYQELFGADQVLAMPYEFFRRTPSQFLNRIGHFVQGSEWQEVEYCPTQVNAARKVLTQLGRRWLNANCARTQFSNSGSLNLPKLVRFYEKASSRLDPFVPVFVEKRMQTSQRDLIRKTVGDYFVSYNRKTSQLTQFDLSALGYRT